MHDSPNKPELKLHREEIQLDENELKQVEGGMQVKIDEVYVSGGYRW